MEGGDPTTEVVRSLGVRGHREVDGKRGGAVMRQFELSAGQHEVLDAVRGLEPIVGQREPGNRHAQLATPDAHLRMRVQREVFATVRQRYVGHAPPPGVEYGPSQLVVHAEAIGTLRAVPWRRGHEPAVPDAD